jgi:hypothetical protein
LAWAATYLKINEGLRKAQHNINAIVADAGGSAPFPKLADCDEVLELKQQSANDGLVDFAAQRLTGDSSGRMGFARCPGRLSAYSAIKAEVFECQKRIVRVRCAKSNCYPEGRFLPSLGLVWK